MDKRSPSAAFYLDSSSLSGEGGTQQRLLNLKQTITSKLNEESVLTLRVPWMHGGLNPYEHDEHQEYLEALHHGVLNWCKEKLYKNLVKQTAYKLWSGINFTYLHDLTTHYHNYKLLTQNKGLKLFSDFHGKLLKCFEKGKKDVHHAMLLFGKEGSGKSTIASKVCTLFVEQMGKSVITVVRYINHHSLAMTGLELVSNLCEQLYEILGQSKTDLPVLKFDALAESFKKCLESLSKRGWTVMVLIDGLHNLKPNSQGSELPVDWIPFKLPVNVHILLTCSNANKAVLQRVKTRAPDKDLWCEVPSVDLKDAVSLANRIFTTHTQTSMPQDKEKLFYKMCKVEPTPLFISLLSHYICYSSADIWSNGSNVDCLEDALFEILNEAEERFGVEVVAAVARYIISGYHGVTETELLDLLSSNNKIMLLVYPYDLPPVLRFPTWLWTSIRNFFGKSHFHHHLHFLLLLE